MEGRQVITLTARWGPWKHHNDRTNQDVTVEPTPGRDRPIVIQCSSKATAENLSTVFRRIGCDVELAELQHIPGCNMWHHQGGDYDRDCPACMTLAAQDQGKPS